MMIRALAILCNRNDAIHMRRCLTHLIDSGLEVYLIDNESTDDSVEIAGEFLDRGLVAIDTLPWHGTLSMSDLLRAKRRVVGSVDHDWVLHLDLDEWPCSPTAGQPLIEAINEEDAAGYTCINFHEIVFVPLDGQDFYREDYAEWMSTYYFYQPDYPRLLRAWNRRAQLDNVRAGGHLLDGGDLRPSPKDFLLRHYIVLSPEHAREKYLGRQFSQEDLDKGWHYNRINITDEDLTVKPVDGLRHLNDPRKEEFDLSSPLRQHFWQW